MAASTADALDVELVELSVAVALAVEVVEVVEVVDVELVESAPWSARIRLFRSLLRVASELGGGGGGGGGGGPLTGGGGGLADAAAEVEAALELEAVDVEALDPARSSCSHCQPPAAPDEPTDPIDMVVPFKDSGPAIRCAQIGLTIVFIEGFRLISRA